jgi:lipocalin
MFKKGSLLVIPMLFCVFTALSAENKSTADIKPVDNLDVNKYMGRWYEIARLPTWFEDGLDYVTATYTLKNDGQVDVLNEGMKNGSHSSAHGNARVQDPKMPSKLSVSFFLWFGSDYIVFELDQTNYQYAMVTSGTKDYLWILSRTPVLEEAVYQRLLDSAVSNGFDLDKLIKVRQADQ